MHSVETGFFRYFRIEYPFQSVFFLEFSEFQTPLQFSPSIRVVFKLEGYFIFRDLVDPYLLVKCVVYCDVKNSIILLSVI